MFSGFPKSGVEWFSALAVAQRREWFQANRSGYDELWLAPMKALLAEIESPLAKVYGRKLGPAKVFRLNRDVRFSKDKSPYKTHIAAVIPFGDYKPMEGPAALYLQLGLDDLVAFGFYALEPAALQRLRKGILHEKKGAELAKRVASGTTKGLLLDAMETLKRAPRGTDPEHPRLELLRRKGLALSTAKIPRGVRYGPALKQWLVAQAKLAAPVLKWGFDAGLAS